MSPTVVAVARELGLDPCALVGRSRAYALAAARREAARRLRERWGLSYTRIGALLGGRAAATVRGFMGAARTNHPRWGGLRNHTRDERGRFA